MIGFVRRQIVFLQTIAVWLVFGFASRGLGAVVSALTVPLLWRIRRYDAVFFALFSILILSDTRIGFFKFAKEGKLFILPLLLVFLILNPSDFREIKNKLFTYILPFALFTILISPFGYDLQNALLNAAAYGMIFLVAPNYFLVALKEYKLDFFSSLLWLFNAIYMIGFVLYIVNPEYALLEGRYRGLLGNSNGLGLFALLSFLLIEVIKSRFPHAFDKKSLRWFYVLVFASILFCQSRNALFSILIYYLFARFRQLSGLVGIFVFSFLAIAFGYVTRFLVQIIVFLGLQEYFRLDTLFEGSGRVVAWDFAWEQINNNFLVGPGMEYTIHVFEQNRNLLSTLGHQGNAHNSYLTIWLDTGLIGILLWVLGIAFFLFRYAKNSPIIQPIIYSIIFSTIFESWLAASMNPFTIQFILLCTVLSIDMNNPVFAELKLPKEASADEASKAIQ